MNIERCLRTHVRYPPFRGSTLTGIHRHSPPLRPISPHPFTPIDAEPPQIYEWPTLDHSGPDQVLSVSWVRTWIECDGGRRSSIRVPGGVRYHCLGRRDWQDEDHQQHNFGGDP